MKKVLCLSSFALLFFSAVHATDFEDVIRMPDLEPFTDIDITSLEGKAAMELKYRDIIGGRPDGRFDGTAPVNRAELAKFLLLAKKTEVGNSENNGKFPDILEGEWYVKYVIKANQEGILNGYPNGKFEPARNVNTAEFLKMLTKTFNLETNMQYSYKDASDSDWFGQYCGVAEYYNLFPNRDLEYLDPARIMSRNEVAVSIWKILQTLVDKGGALKSEVISSSPSSEFTELKELYCTGLTAQISDYLNDHYSKSDPVLLKVFYSPIHKSCLYTYRFSPLSAMLFCDDENKKNMTLDQWAAMCVVRNMAIVNFSTDKTLAIADRQGYALCGENGDTVCMEKLAAEEKRYFEILEELGQYP